MISKLWLVALTFLLIESSTGQQTSIKDFRKMMVWNSSFVVDKTIQLVKSFSVCLFYCHQETSLDCEGLSYNDPNHACEIGSLAYNYEVAANGKYVYTSIIPTKIPHLFVIGDIVSDFSFDPTNSPTYPINSSSWLPSGQQYFLGGPYKNGVMVCGGRASNGALSTSCYYYQPGQTQAEKKANLLAGKYMSAITTVNGNIWFAGGWVGSNIGFDDSSQIFDLSKDTWVAGPKMAFATFQSCLTAIDGADRRFLYAGGFASSSGYLNPIDTSAVYDWSTGIWTNIAALPGGVRASPACTRVTLRDGSTRALVAGGYTLTSSYAMAPTNAVYSLDPNTLLWRPELSLLAPRCHGVLVQVGSIVYYIGGYMTAWTLLPDVYQMRTDGDPTTAFPNWYNNASLTASTSNPNAHYGFLYNV